MRDNNRIEYASGKCCSFANSRTDLIDRLKPVSYTHLDVYKRQEVLGSHPRL